MDIERTSFYAKWTSFDAVRNETPTATQGLNIGTTQGLMDTKPTPQTARMPVRVDMGSPTFDFHGHPGCLWYRFGIPYIAPVQRK